MQDVHLDGSTIIAAKTVWGALHGLETMSQLVDFNFTTGAVFVWRDIFLTHAGCPVGYRVGSGKSHSVFLVGGFLDSSIPGQYSVSGLPVHIEDRPRFT